MLIVILIGIQTEIPAEHCDRNSSTDGIRQTCFSESGATHVELISEKKLPNHPQTLELVMNCPHEQRKVIFLDNSSWRVFPLSQIWLDYLLIYNNDKTPWPRQLVKENVLLGLCSRGLVSTMGDWNSREFTSQPQARGKESTLGMAWAFKTVSPPPVTHPRQQDHNS